MRETRSSGSVRGASGDGRPYRERASAVIVCFDEGRLSQPISGVQLWPRELRMGGSRWFEAAMAALCRARGDSFTLQIACDGVEDAADIRTNSAHNADGGDGDQRGDQTIFDCCYTALVAQEITDQLESCHVIYPSLRV